MAEKLYDYCLLGDSFVQSCDAGDWKKTVAVSNLSGEKQFSQRVPVCLFRMCEYGKNKFIAVDEGFNILTGAVTGNSLELKEFEVPLERMHRAVSFIPSGGNDFFLSYMQTAKGANDAALYRVTM